MRKPALQDAREEWCILASPHFLHVLHNIMFPLSMCECTQIHCRPHKFTVVPNPPTQFTFLTLLCIPIQCTHQWFISGTTITNNSKILMWTLLEFAYYLTKVANTITNSYSYIFSLNICLHQFSGKSHQ